MGENGGWQSGDRQEQAVTWNGFAYSALQEGEGEAVFRTLETTVWMR